jgi:hypothetical protein
MKRLFLLASLLSVGILTRAQQKEVICHTPATEKFAMFASNKEFKKMHPNPLAFVHVSEEGGKSITIKTSGADANAYFIEAKKKSNNRSEQQGQTNKSVKKKKMKKKRKKQEHKKMKKMEKNRKETNKKPA